MNIEEILNKDYNIFPIKIKKINRGVINENYYVTTGEKEYIFKIYKNDGVDKVKFELGICEDLEKNYFPSPRVVKNASNDLFGINEKVYALFHFIPGNTIKDLDKNKMRLIGKLLGKMHSILQNTKQTVEVKTWEPEDIKKLINDHADEVAGRDMKNTREFVDFVKKEFIKINLPELLPTGMTHQDVKPDNIIENRNGDISFIDLNDCYHGVLLHDMMTVIIWTAFQDNKFNIDFLIEFLKGYNEERKLTKIEKESILESLKFRLLREAFVWPLRWLDDSLAKKYAWDFIHFYKVLIKDEDEYRKIISGTNI